MKTFPISSQILLNPLNQSVLNYLSANQTDIKPPTGETEAVFFVPNYFPGLIVQQIPGHIFPIFSQKFR